MKPHVTNLKHQKFCFMIENTLQKLEKIPNEEKIEVLEKITELKSNKDALDEMYKNYQFKLKELSILLDEYDRLQQMTRIHLRKMQLLLKFTYSKLVKDFF